MPSAQKIQLTALTEACLWGVGRYNLLDGSIGVALFTEQLTPKGAGVMITNSSYKRSPARLNDLQSILEILSSPAKHSAIVSRRPEYIGRQIDNYILNCVDEDLVCCCEIIKYADNLAAEITSLVVDKSYRKRGIGSKLVREGVKEMC